MSIQSGDGVLEILDGTLKVSRLDIQDISGLDVGINTLARNMVLLRDDLTAAETPGGAVTSSTGVTRTQNTEIVFTGGYIYWPIKIPNAWTMKFNVYDNLIFSFANTSTPTSATASDNHGGYKMVFDSANARFSFYYQGSEIVATRTTYTTGQWSTVLINYEYGGISVVIDGEQVGNYALTHGEDAYTGEYIGFAGSATSKLKDIKLTNGDKWQYVDGSNASSIAYMNGNVGIGSSSPQKTLDVGGDVKISGNLLVSGTTFVVDQQNLSVKDKIIELGSENTDSSSNVGMIMTTGGSSNVAIGYRGEVGELMIGYTSNVAEDSELTPKDATNLPVKVYGDLDVTRDLSASTISGDGYLLSNVTLSQVVDYGNTTSNTVQFNATDVALKTVGNVAIGTTTAAIDLAIGDANTGLNQEGEDELAVYTAGSERIRVDSDGYVGISTSEPTANLHVVGAQYINDLPTGAGTSSYTHNVAPLTLTSASTTDTTATSVLNLTRPASSDTNVASRASFKVSRWSTDTPTASRSRLDVSLASGAYTNEVTPLTLQANQKVGIMNTSPAHTLSVGSNLYVQDGGDTILTVLGNAVVSDKLTIQGVRVSASAFDGLQATTEADNTTTYPIIINNSTASTSSTTGALIVSGGAGIGGSVYVGTNLDVNADVSVDGDTFNVNAADNRVGILTASPTHPLDVRGAANVQALTATSASITGQLLVNTTTLTTDVNNGYVGVGLSNPASLLHMKGADAELRLEASTGTGHMELGGPDGGYIDVKGPFADDSDMRIQSTGSGGSIIVAGNNSFGITTDGTERVSVGGSGNVAVNTDTLFVDSVNSRVGVGRTDPRSILDINDTGAMIVPVGTTAEQPGTAYAGMLRFNSSLGKLQFYNGTTWSIIGGVIASGGTVTESDGYRIHTFTSASDTFTVQNGGVIEYIIVAGGGGGGGRYHCGGGGAGGVLTGTMSIPGSTYTIVVGAGGSPGDSGQTASTNGNDSIAFGYTCEGGGGGASNAISPYTGANGGSGGGGAGSGVNGASSGGTGISGQGNDGGDGNGSSSNSSLRKGGGGGGAGSVGEDSTSTYPGDGGDGIEWPSGSGTYYGGGGGGGGEHDGTHGLGGTGGGGTGGMAGISAGVTARTETSGTDGTGGGGGGSDNSSNGLGYGGDGIVIIRYLI